jgi:Glycosyltransferase family 87
VTGRETRLGRGETWALLGTLAALVLINAPEIGSDPWPFRPAAADPTGVLAPLVRAADEEWDRDVVRAPAVVAGLLVALAAAAATWRARLWPRSFGIALATVVLALLLVPAVLLQVGLRQATAPWLYTNDSTYQIELGGELILDGENPYGHDYSSSGLQRFYPAVGAKAEEQVALEHFAYFPGTALTAAAWRLLPEPFDDYRVLVLLATLACFFAVLLFRAPPAWTLAVGAVIAASPLAVRAAWFGTADAPSILCLVLAIALLTRSRYVAAAGLLGAAVLLKQFALVALPFFVAMLIARQVPRDTLWKAGAAFGGVVVAGFLPFLIADPGALWDDTVAYGASTYRIIGYGLAGLLVRAGVIEDRFDPYPFVLLAVLFWLPLTAGLVWNQLRSPTLWLGAAGFSISIFVLFFLARVFQTSYLVWPLVGTALAALLAATERPERRGDSA